MLALSAILQRCGVTVSETKDVVASIGKRVRARCDGEVPAGVVAVLEDLFYAAIANRSAS